MSNGADGCISCRVYWTGSENLRSRSSRTIQPIPRVEVLPFSAYLSHSTSLKTDPVRNEDSSRVKSPLSPSRQIEFAPLLPSKQNLYHPSRPALQFYSCS